MSLGITVENETWPHTEVVICSNKREEECFSTVQSVSKHHWCLTSCSGYSNWPLRAGRSIGVIVMYHAGYTAICCNGFPLVLFVVHQTQNTEADLLQLSITHSRCTHLIIENGVLWGAISRLTHQVFQIHNANWFITAHKRIQMAFDLFPAFWSKVENQGNSYEFYKIQTS